MGSTTARRGSKPQPEGLCACGQPCVDYAAEWIAPGARYHAHSTSGDIPDRYYHGEVWTPVCYPVTPERFRSRPYVEHVIRLGETQGRHAEVVAIRRQYAALLGSA